MTLAVLELKKENGFERAEVGILDQLRLRQSLCRHILERECRLDLLLESVAAAPRDYALTKDG